jgi:hypothetical protein
VGTGSFVVEIYLIEAAGTGTGYAVALEVLKHWFGMTGTGKGLAESATGSGSWAATASSKTHRNRCLGFVAVLCRVDHISRTYLNNEGVP